MGHPALGTPLAALSFWGLGVGEPCELDVSRLPSAAGSSVPRGTYVPAVVLRKTREFGEPYIVA